MKLKISKSQWESMGRQAGWMPKESAGYMSGLWQGVKNVMNQPKPQQNPQKSLPKPQVAPQVAPAKTVQQVVPVQQEKPQVTTHQTQADPQPKVNEPEKMDMWELSNLLGEDIMEKDPKVKRWVESIASGINYDMNNRLIKDVFHRYLRYDKKINVDPQTSKEFLFYLADNVAVTWREEKRAKEQREKWGDQ